VTRPQRAIAAGVGGTTIEVAPHGIGDFGKITWEGLTKGTSTKKGDARRIQGRKFPLGLARNGLYRSVRKRRISQRQVFCLTPSEQKAS